VPKLRWFPRPAWLLRVDNNVVDDLADLVPVEIAVAEIVGRVEPARNARTAEREKSRVADKREKRVGFLGGRAAPRKGQQLLGQPARLSIVPSAFASSVRHFLPCSLRLQDRYTRKCRP